MPEINSVQDISNLLVSGYDDWEQHGHVAVKHWGNLTQFNYTAKAQYEGNWTFFERTSRGLVINNQTGEIVARPFSRFFNWLEGGRTSSGHIVNITEKIDGSMIILLWDGGFPKTVTRGSFESDQAFWAQEILWEKWSAQELEQLPNEYTLIFELLHPDNRIVVDHGDRRDLILLAARNRFTGEYMPFFPDLYELAHEWNFSLPKVYNFNSVGDIIEQTDSIPYSQEGFVAEFSDGQRFKFKGDRYLEIHKAISTLSIKNVARAMKNGTLDDMMDAIPDEFLIEVSEWVGEISATIEGEKIRINRWMQKAPKTDSRKDFALWVKDNCPERAHYLFALLDDRDITDMIFRERFDV